MNKIIHFFLKKYILHFSGSITKKFIRKIDKKIIKISMVSKDIESCKCGCGSLHVDYDCITNSGIVSVRIIFGVGNVYIMDMSDEKNILWYKLNDLK